jgi:ketosteroid isomerase-like protein
MLFAMTLLAGGAAFAGPREDAVAVADKFITIFSAGKSVDDMVAIFTPDALMYGTTMLEAATGSKAVRDYFTTAFARGAAQASILSAEANIVSDNTVILAGKWQVQRPPAAPAPLRYTMVVTRTASGPWLIAHLHSSRPESVFTAATAAAPAPAAPAAPR